MRRSQLLVVVLNSGTISVVGDIADANGTDKKTTRTDIMLIVILISNHLFMPSSFFDIVTMLQLAFEVYHTVLRFSYKMITYHIEIKN